MSRYYPGFLAAFFIILLRIAIGWHFLYEGCEKVQATVEGKEPFSAEIYLRNANGPLGPYFRGMLPDVNSLAMLDSVRLKASWKDDVSFIGDHYGFTQEQREKAQKVLDESLRWADYWFGDPENIEKIHKYERDLGQILATERDPDALSFQKERASDARRGADADRRSLILPLISQEKSLREGVAKWATPEQVKAAGATREAILTLLAKAGIGSGSTRTGSHDRRAGPMDRSRRAQRSDDVRADRDRVLPGRWLPDAPGFPVSRGFSGNDLLLHAPLAWPTSQSEGRRALPDREQESDRTDCLPGDRDYAKRSLGRPGCTLLRCATPAPAGRTGRAAARGKAVDGRQKAKGKREKAKNRRQKTEERAP